jgi:hypothetical protein
VVLFLFLGGLGFIGYHIYLSATKIQETATERMGRKNVVFTKDGLRVGVKEMKNENYVDRTQSWVVKAWNLSGQGIEDKRYSSLTRPLLPLPDYGQRVFQRRPVLTVLPQ